ncbi:MAG TPA: glycosyltransferase family 4 protein [Blastocatellia bacterium]|nr:glycosyltransferase family 4 protein [Blastocatellia bacterium]
MRILVVSNFYPPHYIGGYELGCSDVVEGLKARGHEVLVLTSTYGHDGPHNGGGVYRWLESDFALKSPSDSTNFFRLVRKESANRRAFNRLCRLIRPDIVYVWNATHISIAIAFAAQRRGLPVCYFVSDNWLSRWESDPWYSQRYRRPRRIHRRLLWRPLRSLLSRSDFLPKGTLDLSHVQFASQYLKQAALEAHKPVANADVFHWGVNLDCFRYKERPGDRRRLLYVGQITPHKGVHTAIEALKLIVERPRYESTTLTVVGGPDYNGRVHRLVSSLGLESKVCLTGQIPREQLPQIYHEHDILLFPSVWEEPFSITLLEAMASGLAVVGTNTGGSSEILEDGVNALIFPKEDTPACAGQVLRLMEEAELFERIRLGGRRTVEEHFRFENMLDRIEASLKKLIR